MPSKNVIREYDTNVFYHVYNRGVNKREIFLEDRDYGMFLHLLKRSLSDEPHKDSSGREYEKHDAVELLAFCLMPNHFHLFLYQKEDTGAITKLLRSVCTAYTMYFNKRYKRNGPLFQGKFRASRITKDAYLQHISRYIHSNPAHPLEYRWSSLPYYMGRLNATWVKPGRVMAMFSGKDDYLQFMQNYREQQEILQMLKYELADV